MHTEEKEEVAVPIYNAEPAKFEFQIRGAGGVIEDYYMLELLGDEREAYMNSIIGKFEITANGRSKVKNFTGIQSGLLARCVYDRDNVLVREKLISKWPSKLQSDLYIKAQQMSGMDETAAEKAKND